MASPEHSQIILERTSIIAERRKAKEEAQRAEEEQRAAERKRAYDEKVQIEEEKIAGVEPIIVAILQDLEANYPDIKNAPEHTIEIQKIRMADERGDPYVCNQYTLAWGDKVRLNEADQELIAHYKRSRNPVKKLAHPKEIASLDANLIQVSISGSHVNIEGKYDGYRYRGDYLKHDDIVMEDKAKLHDAFANAIMSPKHHSAVLRRSHSYES